MNGTGRFRLSQVVGGVSLTALAVVGFRLADLDTVMAFVMVGLLVGGVGLVLENGYYALNPAADGFEPGPVMYYGSFVSSGVVLLTVVLAAVL
ncbi:hypothetical protein [Halalkalicoccus subterraneus]|uniref:hypothetical protein n=1 Tax=Halalkalicoccus subterraneus TaxID=2675002 RepID=UPI000EFAD074|nr:hypothetical protein [Halalkalicoccus subterraneus]